jgi:hypothetical protein
LNISLKVCYTVACCVEKGWAVKIRDKPEILQPE